MGGKGAFLEETRELPAPLSYGRPSAVLFMARVEPVAVSSGKDWRRGEAAWAGAGVLPTSETGLTCNKLFSSLRAGVFCLDRDHCWGLCHHYHLQVSCLSLSELTRKRCRMQGVREQVGDPLRA